MSVREGLLALLATEPEHGYQLRQDFKTATAGVWPLNVGQVYTTLDRLERDGLVEAASDATAERRSFQITESGRVELEDWFSAGPHEQPHRETTVIKVLVALHTDGVDARQVIDVQRAALTDSCNSTAGHNARRSPLPITNPAWPNLGRRCSLTHSSLGLKATSAGSTYATNE